MKYAYIQEYRSRFEVKKMAKALQLSRSGYYAWVKRADSPRKRDDQMLVEQIKAVYYQSRSIYGSPRVTAQLHREGITCGKNRVARLMRQHQLRSRKQRKYKATTNSKHHYPVAANLLNQNFVVQKPNTAWVADISYISTREGWLYLAGIKDLCTQKIVGWSMDKTMTRSLTMQALQMALIRQKPNRGLILHSDRGVQYACHEYQALLKSYGIRCSMSRSGNPYDNAPMESFFSTLKTEWVHHFHYQSRSEAKSSIFDYIERFYNSNRLNSVIGYMSPTEFEQYHLSAVSRVHFSG
jgi:transposase InsO family protein